jgi:hypothetical protein
VSSRHDWVCIARHSETAWRTTSCRRIQTKAGVAEELERISRAPVQPADVVPHQLGAEHAVRGRPPLADARHVLGVAADALERGIRRRLGRGGPADQRERLRVVKAFEVGLGAGRPTGRHYGLEVLLGTPGDAGGLERLAEQGAAAARRGADEIGPVHA